MEKKRAVVDQQAAKSTTGAMVLIAAKADQPPDLSGLTLEGWPASDISFASMPGWLVAVNECCGREKFKASPFPGFGRIVCSIMGNVILLIAPVSELSDTLDHMASLETLAGQNNDAWKKWQWVEVKAGVITWIPYGFSYVVTTLDKRATLLELPVFSEPLAKALPPADLGKIEANLDAHLERNKDKSPWSSISELVRGSLQKM